MIVRPGKVVPAHQRANLRKGGTKSPGRPKLSKKDKEIRELAKKLLTDPWYKRKLIQRLREGSIQPGVEALLYYYAFGKPKETVETITPPPVKIVFEMPADEPCKPSPKKK